MSEPEVLIGVEGTVGRLTLNRTKALHALTLGMCQAMTEALLAWRDDPAFDVVMIDHAGERGFCAGGDIRMLAESGQGDGRAARAFFHTEYRLNHLLFTYPKPVIAFMDGITLGGGVGISAPARYRVATERTAFAMPETGIGLFPDVGGGWYLSRLPGRAGYWLALTGARIKGADCLSLGLATHFVESSRLPALKRAIIAEPRRLVEQLRHAARSPGPAPIDALMPLIGELFDSSCAEEIFADLAAHPSEWAAEQLAVLRTKSPQAIKIALRQIETGAMLTAFADNMAMEYRIASRVVGRADFLEGERAVIVDKDDQPSWSPATLEEVTDALLDEIFAPLPEPEEWIPLPETA